MEGAGEVAADIALAAFDPDVEGPDDEADGPDDRDAVLNRFNVESSPQVPLSE